VVRRRAMAAGPGHRCPLVISVLQPDSATRKAWHCSYTPPSNQTKSRGLGRLKVQNIAYVLFYHCAQRSWDFSIFIVAARALITGPEENKPGK
jgi:hypothetical protein